MVTPFLTDDEMFAFGVEFGMLYERMKLGEPIELTFHLENQDRITLMASRLGWMVEEMKTLDEDWFACRLEPPQPSYGNGD